MLHWAVNTYTAVVYSQRSTSLPAVPMDWILGEFKFRGHDFKAWHFDVSAGEGSNADAPRLSGDEEDALEDATGEIGAVLWSEAAIACLQHLQDIKKSYAGCKVLELGAGCGFVGLALAADGAKVTFRGVHKHRHPIQALWHPCLAS